MVPRIARFALLPILVMAGAMALAGAARPITAATVHSARRSVAKKPAAKRSAADGPAAAAARADTSAREMDPFVYLSWHRPYGMPGATSDLTPSIGPGQRDTLWLVAAPRHASKLYGISIQLAFHPAAGDTLDPEWTFGGTGEDARHIRIEWPQRSWPVRNPWSVGGFGGVHYERRVGYGWLNILYAVNSDSATAVMPGTRYALARILFPSMSPGAARHPVCIEWASGEWAYDLNGPEGQPAIGGARFVSVSSPDGSVCRAHRSAQRLNPYRFGLPDPGRPAPRR